MKRWQDRDGDEWIEDPPGEFRPAGHATTSVFAGRGRASVEQRFGPLREITEVQR